MNCGKKLENSKWQPFFENFSKSEYSALLTYPRVENFDKTALSPTVKETETILCFHWPLCGLRWHICERMRSKLKLNVFIFQIYPHTKQDLGPGHLSPAFGNIIFLQCNSSICSFLLNLNKRAQ